LTDDSLQSADKDQQESCAVAEKPHDAVVKFDTYRSLQWHRTVVPATARLSCLLKQRTKHKLLKYNLHAVQSNKTHERERIK